MKRFQKWMLLIAAVLAFCVTPTMALAAPSEGWAVSKSITATNLDKAFDSTINITMPSEQEELISDIVFVLDKSTSTVVEEQALNMLAELKAHVEDTDAAVKVGIVIFNKKANVSPWYNLETQYADIEAFMKTKIKSGTNTHAGLLAGKALLDNDAAVEDHRKFLIFVSDGITYMFNEEPTATAWSFDADGIKNWAGADNWNSKYHTNNAPASWETFFEKIGAQEAVQGTRYDYPYGGTVVESTPVEKYTEFNNSVDKALYYTYLTYTAAQQAGYHCYVMPANNTTGTAYKWGPEFMKFLANGENVSYDEIKKDILYVVDNGSILTDVVGYVENDYDFDLKDLESFSLRVGGREQSAVVDAELNSVFFGEPDAQGVYPYILIYHPGEALEEAFALYFNVPVSSFERVELTYDIHLTNPKTAAGTYGQYDRDGSQMFDSLYTNCGVVLYPVMTNGEEVAPEVFAVPTVSYVVTDIPETGDESDLMLWSILFLGSALIIGMAVKGGRKNAKNRA